MTNKRRYFVLANKEEERLIEEKRKAAGMGVSEFFRSAALRTDVVHDRELCALLLQLSHDLRRIGNLFRMELSNPERFSGNESYRRRVEKDHADIMAIAERVEAAAGGLS